MTDLFDKQEREKEVQDFDAVWPDDDRPSIIKDWRDAFRRHTGCEASEVSYSDGFYVVKFSDLPEEKFTENEIKSATRRLKELAPLEPRE